MKNADMPAMPTFVAPRLDGGVDIGEDGLTKREHFAGLAMHALVAESMQRGRVMHASLQEVAEMQAQTSCLMADALLAELENGKRG